MLVRSVGAVPPFLLSAVSGLGLGLSLIVAIGAQNAYVLQQGLQGDRVWLVVGICVLSDVVLIAASTTLAAIPSIVIYVVLQRQFISGITQGSIK